MFFNIKELKYKNTALTKTLRQTTLILKKYLFLNLLISQITADSENEHTLNSNNVLRLQMRNISW